MTADPTDGKQLLIDLLREAAELELCLLNAYLYSACSLRSTPQELAEIEVGEGTAVNVRRAVHFERIRSWKLSILQVAHEEMLHLHYVQCMLRALGADPHFGLPDRDATSGAWRFPAWRSTLSGDDGGPEGVEIPVDPLTPANVGRFVQYEATDALQDIDPFGPDARDLYHRLQAFEQDFRIASVLHGVDSGSARTRIKERLDAIYRTLTPVPRPEAESRSAAFAAPSFPSVEDVRFQSIADLYRRAIQPLYEEAFDLGWVEHDNRDLNNELQDGDVAGQGFLPIGPVHRDKNFDKRADANTADPLRNYRRLSDIIDEIVNEGEGFANFSGRATTFLAEVADAGGAAAYLVDLLADADPATPTRPIVRDGELLRNSHLGRFAVIWAELDDERALASEVGATFDPVRAQVDPTGSRALQAITDELPAQFNACYLVLVAWLSRIYEVRDWAEDAAERGAIEMLASWPLMSMSIRPMLELASLFPIDRTALFRTDAEHLPDLPLHARQLAALWSAPDRDPSIDERMDHHALRALEGVAQWCEEQHQIVTSIPGLDPHTRELIRSRLAELTHLSTFKAQFPYRVAGGYSDRMPDLTYQQGEPGADRFEEVPMPSTGEPPRWKETALLKLRFAGWGLVQLATDPDPPSDEAGCSGTHQLHAADGDRRFDKAVVWQVTDPERTIVRDHVDLPPIGVTCLEAAVVVTGDHAAAGYLPVLELSSQGPIETDGIQNRVEVRGLNPVVTRSGTDLTGGPYGIDLRAKGSARPFLNGFNHLVSQDGEAIDPFILAVVSNATGTPEVLVEREIFNDGTAFAAMTPLEQLQTSRRPVGFEQVDSMPPWAEVVLPERSPTSTPPAFATGYLRRRAGVLIEALDPALQDASTQAQVDDAISLAERARLVAVPRGTTWVWLQFLLHYGHTVSGESSLDPGLDPMLADVLAGTGLTAAVRNEHDRDKPNSRWFIDYTLGVMDTDSLRNVVYGDLYVPLRLSAAGAVTLGDTFTFPAGVERWLTAIGCRFDQPFWSSDYVVEGTTRTLRIDERRTQIETLVAQRPDGYDYEIAGLPGAAIARASITVNGDDSSTTLTWTVTAEPSAGVTTSVAHVAAIAGQMRSALELAATPVTGSRRPR